ncbi:MAG: hypothetical protein QHH75_10840 [Bacillota bacterium]|nr:hypothetical protein [Bacillota bacterium]
MPKKMPSEFRVYTFKVYLGRKRLKRPRAPWRLIEIRGDQTLADLHEVIFEAFDRFEEHLYSFFIGGKEFAPEEAGWPSSDTTCAVHAVIGGFEFEIGDWFTYLFDYGDEWWHVVELVKIEERLGSDPVCPRVIERRGQSPLQYPDLEEE